MNWSQEQVIKFMELYGTEPVLWDPKLKHYKDKRKKHEAWLRLEQLMKLPVEELKQKKDSLLATYRGYCRKKQASINSGDEGEDVFHPSWFAFDTIDQFLGSVFKCRPSRPQAHKETEEEGVEEEEVVIMDSSDVLSIDLTESTQNAASQNTSPPERSERKKLIRRRHYNPPTPFNNVFYRRTNEMEDECDIFGKLISKKLKKLPDDKREELMYEIHSLFRNINAKKRNFMCINCQSDPLYADIG